MAQSKKKRTFKPRLNGLKEVLIAEIDGKKVKRTKALGNAVADSMEDLRSMKDSEVPKHFTPLEVALLKRSAREEGVNGFMEYIMGLVLIQAVRIAGRKEVEKILDEADKRGTRKKGKKQQFDGW